MFQYLDSRIHKLFVIFHNFDIKSVNYHVRTLGYCLATSVLCWHIMFPNVRQEHGYLNYPLGLLKNQFTTRKSEKMKRKNGIWNTWE